MNTSNFKISSDQLYLQKELESTAAPAEEGVAFTVVTKKTKKQIKSGNPETAPTITLPFKNVTEIVDSHSRRAPPRLSNVQNFGSRGTNIGGLCKPGAGLLSVAPAPAHPPDHCCPLMAGTNDVAAGKQDIIFSRLENIVEDCCSSSELLVLSLPTRHDLPSNSPVHQTTAHVNNYIAELCIRYEGAEMLDINNMDRSHFTPHGLHLRASGKQLLADLILQRIAGMMPRPRRRVTEVTAPIRSTLLQRLDHTVTPAPPADPCGPSPPAHPRSPAAHTSPAPPEPPVRTMAYDTFAEAVKS
ncbi:hypothetical protein J6590_015876 [Homalodisca vitripennis]|nr:hypothetical protein J6590_015876 [Homalodisca vitripennis]